MKIAGYTLILIALLATGIEAFSTDSYSAAQTRPLIFGVHIDGKKIVVEGSGFDRDAFIRVNHKRQKTEADDDSPATVLVSKKAGKKIKIDDFTTSVQVQNGDGQRSNFVYLYKTNSLTARLIVFALQAEITAIHLKPGGYILIDSRSLPSTDRFDPIYFRQVSDPPFDASALRLYQVQRSGETGFEITQQFNVNVGLPPPPLIWRLTIQIE